MYGLIHTALKGFILEAHGEDVWNEVVETSGVAPNSFLTMRSYDDEVTLALVGATSTVLDLPVEECLEVFGRYWIRSFAPREYGKLLDHTGDSPIEFLQNLDDLHDRISTSFTEFKPPSFRVVINDAKSATVRYVSPREGLTPFVVGILSGLGDRFATKIDVVSRKKIPSDEGEHCDISISLEKCNA